MDIYDDLINDLKEAADPVRAKILAGFFKTGKGEYGYGDKFYGITVPQSRLIASKYSEATLKDLEKLLVSPIHEYRLTGLLILIGKYRKSEDIDKKEYAEFYLKHTGFINNWDLVDLSAPNILGDFLLTHDRKILYALARSTDLWERRMAIISTYRFIKLNQFDDTLRITRLLLKDKHDLIHKACGWMLREIGKQNPALEEEFLQKYGALMPRTMLRYAIERFSPDKRLSYLKAASLKHL